MVEENIIRLGSFVGIFALMACIELILPRRELEAPKSKRWFTNLAIVVLDTLVVRLVMPILPVGMALYAATQGWGLFNMIAIPVWVECIFSIFILDLAIYWQHVAFHVFPLFWRFHRMHHADVDLDVTSGLRFHPIEILISLVYKLVVIVLLGPSALAVVLFEVILNGMAMFNHSNVLLPQKLDAFLRLVLVTPDMHRVHHSVLNNETDSNYGFNISWWDKLFKTYIPQPKKGHTGMTIGLTSFREKKFLRLDWTLYIPFLKDKRK